VRGFLVEKGTTGFNLGRPARQVLAARLDHLELGFHDCKIPGENLLPGTTGLKNALMCLNQARYGIAWGGLGAAMGVLPHGVDLRKERVQFGGQPIAAHQLVQESCRIVSEINQGAAPRLPDGEAQDQAPEAPAHPRSASATTSGSPERAPGSPARSWAPMASSTTTGLPQHAEHRVVFTYEGRTTSTA